MWVHFNDRLPTADDADVSGDIAVWWELYDCAFECRWNACWLVIPELRIRHTHWAPITPEIWLTKPPRCHLSSSGGTV